MKKKIIIPLSLLFILFLTGFFFWDANRWERDLKKGSVDDFVIKETPEGKIVENKRENLTIVVPEGWTIEKDDLGYKPGDQEAWQINLYSPDIEYIDFPRPIPASQKKPMMFKKGCGFSIGFETLRGIIEGTHQDIESFKKLGYPRKGQLEENRLKIEDEEGKVISNQGRIIEIKNHLAERVIYTYDLKAGLIMDIYIPVNTFKDLSFHLSFPLNEEERCIGEFKKLLENASI